MKPLEGVCIVLTRPKAQAEALAARIAALGGEPIVFPVLEIVPVDEAPLEALLARLAEFDLAVFISANAVEHGMRLVAARRGLPAGLRVAAIGPATRAALAKFGVEEVIVPAEGFDSEALLAFPALQDMAGKRVLVFRGRGGREVLAEALRRRVAAVEYAEVYRRVVPATDPAPLLERWEEVHAVSVMSAESLTNLLDLLGPAGRDRLAATPLFVPHPRVAEFARKLGLAQILVAGPGDEALIGALQAKFNRQETTA